MVQKKKSLNAATSESTVMSRRVLLVLLCLIVFAALGLRLHLISARSLWLDESLSWKLQSFPISLMIERTGEPTTTHPPLYFLTLHFWTRVVGDSEAAMRILSVIFGIATIPAMFLLLRSLPLLTPRRGPDEDRQSVAASLLACGLLALSNLHIHHAQQVRGYTLAAFLLVVSSLFLVRALSLCRPARTDWPMYVVCAVALCYTHNLGLFSVCAQWLFAVLYLWAPKAVDRFRVNQSGGSWSNPEQSSAGVPATNGPDCSSEELNDSATRLRRARILFIISSLVFSAAYVPWLSRTVGQSQKLRSSWTRRMTLDSVPVEIEQALTTTSLQRDYRPSFVSWSIAAGLLLLWIVLVVRFGWPGAFLCLLGAIPIILIAIYSVSSKRTIYNARYMMFAQQMWLAAIAWIVSRMSYRTEQMIVTLLIMSWCAYWCFDSVISDAPKVQPGIRAAVSQIINNRQSNEIVIAETPFVFFGAQYYARNDFEVKLCADAKDRFLLNGESQLLNEELVTPDETIAAAPQGVWVVSSESYLTVARSKDPPNCVVPQDLWILQDEDKFDQDVFWERPVEVRHFVTAASTEAQQGAE